jgi:hypothetical protein
MKHSFRNKYDNLVLSSATGISIIPGHVTPALLKSRQPHGFFKGHPSRVRSDQSEFQSFRPPHLSAVVRSPSTACLESHAFDNACRHNDADDCAEANLDIQYIMAMGTNVPTTYHYDDSSAGFLTWLRQVTLSADIANVYIIRSGSFLYIF